MIQQYSRIGIFAHSTYKELVMHEPIPTWVHFFGQRRLEGAREIIQALEHAGIQPHLSKPERPNGPGVLCFETISPELCDYLRLVSHGGDARVLAVATPDAAVSSADLWPVLQAGASDAFLWRGMPNAAAQIAARLQRWQAVDQLVESPLVKKKPGRQQRDVEIHSASNRRGGLLH